VEEDKEDEGMRLNFLEKLTSLLWHKEDEPQNV
jgi:hypothetical protein